MLQAALSARRCHQLLCKLVLQGKVKWDLVLTDGAQKEGCLGFLCPLLKAESCFRDGGRALQGWGNILLMMHRAMVATLDLWDEKLT